MRKLLSMLAVIALIACTSEDETLETKSQNKTIQGVSDIRSLDEALQIAQNSIELLDGKAATRAAKPRTIDLKANKVVRATSTRGSSLSNDTLMYVFNFKDNQGFAIVAAPRRVDPLIAVTEKGDYDPQNPPQIEGLKMYMSMTQVWLTELQGKGGDIPHPITKEEYGRAIDSRGPFVSVRWGKQYPEGEYCPNGISGCTNTALGQILSYYEYPSSINLTYPDADVSTQTFNWTEMKAHQTGHAINSCTQYQDAHRAIGRLMRQLGYMNSSIYRFNPPSTGTADNPVATTVSNLGFHQQNWVYYDSLYAYNQLKANHPMMIGGFQVGAGHHWVLDGYFDRQFITYYYERSSTNPNEWVLYDTYIQHNVLYHFNWGWYGECDGYFNSNVFNTANAYFYDNFEGANDIEYNFQIGVMLLPIYHDQE